VYTYTIDDLLGLIKRARAIESGGALDRLKLFPFNTVSLITMISITCGNYFERQSPKPYWLGASSTHISPISSII
jgi:hypothetical protein